MSQRYFDMSAKFLVGGTIERVKRKQDKLPNGVRVQLSNANSQKHLPNEEDGLQVAHWTACAYNDLYDDYTFNVMLDVNTGIPYLVRCVAKGKKPQHLWTRNSNTTSWTFCAGNGARVTDGMVELMAKALAEHSVKHGYVLTDNLYIPDKKLVGGSLVPTGLGDNMVPRFVDHAMIAKLDNYFPDRVDIGSYLPADSKSNLHARVFAKAKWYRSKVKYDGKGKAILEFDAIL